MTLLFASTLLTSCSTNRQGRNMNTTRSPESASTITDAGATNYEGNVEKASCEAIVGWVWEPKRPDSSIDVDIYDGDRKLATVTANQPRQDLIKAGKGNGAHGFIYAIPDKLKDGHPHSIRIKLAAANTDLSQAPRSITCESK